MEIIKRIFSKGSDVNMKKIINENNNLYYDINSLISNNRGIIQENKVVEFKKRLHQISKTGEPQEQNFKYKMLLELINNEIKRNTDPEKIKMLKSEIKELEEFYNKQDKSIFFKYNTAPFNINSKIIMLDNKFDVSGINNVLLLKEVLKELKEEVLIYLKDMEKNKDKRKSAERILENYYTKLSPYIDSYELRNIMRKYYSLNLNNDKELLLFEAYLNNLYISKKESINNCNFKQKIDKLHYELNEMFDEKKYDISSEELNTMINENEESKEYYLFLNKYKNNKIKARY